MSERIRDIKPESNVIGMNRERWSEGELNANFPLDIVAALTGLSTAMIKKVIGSKKNIELREVFTLLDLDDFNETFVPRSRIPEFLLERRYIAEQGQYLSTPETYTLVTGAMPEILSSIADKSVQCVVTSTPYWGLRTYVDNYPVRWADGEECMYGHENTPEGFIRHSVEILYLLKRVMKDDGSVWWNVMDSYNTRTQVRGNASETLQAMQGKDTKKWKDHSMRRYSAGHAFLKDGEQSLIPQRIAERASRIGYWTKSVITWKKTGSMPETVTSRVTRELEYIIHLSLTRTPYFNKSAYNTIEQKLGGRNTKFEAEKITDVWALSTSNGLNGHGAQFPLSLPGRCISLSSKPGDLILDPFVGAGTTVVAALALERKAIGIDMSDEYIQVAEKMISKNLLLNKNLKLL